MAPSAAGTEEEGAVSRARSFRRKAAAGARGLLSRAKGLVGSDATAREGESAGLHEADGAFNAANRTYEPGLFAEVREGWVRRHMTLRRTDYTTRVPVSVRVSCWNVGGKRPPTPLPGGSPAELGVAGALDPSWLLGGDGLPALDGRSDVHVIGLQEARFLQ